MKHLPIILCAALVAYTFLPSRPVVESGPVTKALASASSADRAKVAGIYRALADVTKRDQGKQIGSTAVWRAVHSSALRLAVGGTDLVGKYPGLDTAVDETLKRHVSLDNLPLSSSYEGKPVWERIVEGCKAVEAQAGG